MSAVYSKVVYERNGITPQVVERVLPDGLKIMFAVQSIGINMVWVGNILVTNPLDRQMFCVAPTIVIDSIPFKLMINFAIAPRSSMTVAAASIRHLDNFEYIEWHRNEVRGPK